MTNRTDESKATTTHIPAPCRLLDGVGPTESELSFSNLTYQLVKAVIKAISSQKPNLMTKKHKYIIARL